jgi:transposase
MLVLTPHMRISVAIDPIDFRGGMNRLSAIAKELFPEDPQSGILFVFRNKNPRKPSYTYTTETVAI